jgi:hypothetical protein
VIGLDGIEEPSPGEDVERVPAEQALGEALVEALGSVDLSNPTEVGKALAIVDVIDRRVYEAKQRLRGVLIDYSVERGERTFMVPGVGKFVRDGGPASETVWTDPAGLARKLEAAGMPLDRVREIVVETIDRKVAGVEANKAAKSPQYAAIFDEHRAKVDRAYGLRRASS